MEHLKFNKIPICDITLARNQHLNMQQRQESLLKCKASLQEKKWISILKRSPMGKIEKEAGTDHSSEEEWSSTTKVLKKDEWSPSEKKHPMEKESSEMDSAEEEWSPTEVSEDEWSPIKRKPPESKMRKKARTDHSSEDKWISILKRSPKKKISSKNRAISKEDDMSEYEKMILMNKEKSLAFLKSLNMEEVKESFCEGVHNLKQKPKRAIEKKAKRSPSLPCRKSSRLSDKFLDLSEKAVGERNIDFKEQRIMKEKRIFEEQRILKEQRIVEEPVILPKVLKFEETFKGSNRFSNFINDFSGLNYEETEKTIRRVPLQFESMKFKFRIANIVNAVSAVTIHPDRDKIIISVGSSTGQLCFYNMNSSNSYLFHPHCKKISNLKFNPYDSNQIVSSSHDGKLLCGDIEGHVFDEVHKAMYGRCTYFDILSKPTFIVAEDSGNVAIVDNRSKNTVTKYHPCNDCIVRSVCVHPLEKNYFISSDFKGFIMLWDLRKLQNLPVLNLGHHSKDVTSAFFSPVTGKSILSTSMDNSLCIFDSSNFTAGISLKKLISHDNHRDFKAVWAPNSEDIFAVGSLLYPRRVEIFEDNGNKINSLMDKNVIGILPHQAFHPSLAVLASGTASRHVFVFTDGV